MSRQARRIYKSILVRPHGMARADLSRGSTVLFFLGMFSLLVATETRLSATHAFPISTGEQT